jgi:RAB protein geranylgeranyltransferase component A
MARVVIAVFEEYTVSIFTAEVQRSLRMVTARSFEMPAVIGLSPKATIRVSGIEQKILTYLKFSGDYEGYCFLIPVYRAVRIRR